jgi:membrane-bound lytic murein transglycosylase B
MVKILLLLGMVLAEAIISQPIAAANYFDSLQTKLIQDGFKIDYVKKLYISSRAVFDVDTVSYYFVQRESKMNYGRFLEDAAVEKTAHYIEKFNGIFANVEKKYSVPKEIISAILFCAERDHLSHLIGGNTTWQDYGKPVYLQYPFHLSCTG